MRAASNATRHALLWPLDMTAFCLAAPLSWSYYYIAPVAFAPVLLDRLEAWRGSAVLAVVLAGILPMVIGAAKRVAGTILVAAIIGTLSMAVLAAGFLAAALRSPRDKIGTRRTVGGVT